MQWVSTPSDLCAHFWAIGETSRVRARERERERERDAKPAFRNDGTAKTDTPPERKGDSGEMIEQLK